MHRLPAPDDTRGLRVSDAAYARLTRALLVLVALADLLALASLWLTGAEPARYAGALLILAAVAVSWVFERRRDPGRATLILLCAIWLALALTAVRYAGIHTDVAIFFPFLLGTAGWMLGTRWLLRLLAASLALFVGLGVLEWLDVFRPSPRVAAPVSLALIGSGLAISGLLSWLALRSHRQSITQIEELTTAMADQSIAVALKEQELQTILDTIPAGIAKYDMDGKMLFCNRYYADLFDKTPAQLRELPVTDYVSAEMEAEFRRRIDRLRAGEPLHYERRWQHRRSGAEHCLDVHLIPHTEHDGTKTLITQAIDVTEKVRAEEALQDLNVSLELRVEQRSRELAEAMQTLHHAKEELLQSDAKAALGGMVASVTHEMNTPIANSLMAAGTLESEAESFATKIETGQLRRSEINAFLAALDTGTKLISRNLERTAELLKNFKQVAADQASEQRRPFDLAATVADVLGMLQPQIRRLPHRIEVEIPAGIVLDSYPGPLGQVLVNLINNAYLHAFEHMAQGTLTIRARADEDTVHIQVEDNGAGMSQDTLNRLFQPFFSTKIGHGGTGLGMSIVESIVRKTLGGALEVRSEPGHGTRYDIRLPRHAAS